MRQTWDFYVTVSLYERLVSYSMWNELKWNSTWILWAKNVLHWNNRELSKPFNASYSKALPMQWWIEQRNSLSIFIFISSQWLGSFVCRVTGKANYQLFDLATDAETESPGLLTSWNLSFPFFFLPLFTRRKKDPAVLSFNSLRSLWNHNRGRTPLITPSTRMHLRDGNHSHLAFTSHWAHNCRK